METNTLIQYTIAGVIVALAILWVLWKVIRKNKSGNSACYGCALSEACTKPRKERKAPQKPDCHRQPSAPAKAPKEESGAE